MMVLIEIMEKIRRGKLSREKLMQDCLDRIEKFNPEINALISIGNSEDLLSRARNYDKQNCDRKHDLRGLPVIHKDIFTTRDYPTTCASKMLDGYISPFDATVVEKCNQAGLITIAKANMDEFAMGSSNENSYFGAVKNPFDPKAVSGGSSGGSAAAVAAEFAPTASGTDTGGSIRQPAAFCGVTGIKPTYGRISRYGMISYASSLDQGGVLAKSARDCALMLDILCGFDPKDSTSLELEKSDFASLIESELSIKDLRIGVPRDFLKSVDSKIGDQFSATEETFSRIGAKVVGVSMPSIEYAVSAYYVLASAEASSNLSRYDGIKFGYRTSDYSNLEEMYCRTRAEGFGLEVKRRILMGTYVLSQGFYDAYYRKAQKIRRLILNDYLRAFEDCDVILSPVSPSVAWDLNAKLDPVDNYLSDVFTLSLNMAGLPGIAFPVGFDGKRPIGLQLQGQYLREDILLKTVMIFQNHTDFHRATIDNCISIN